MPRQPERRLGAFILRLLILLPLCFAAWYLLAAYWLLPAALLTEWTLQLSMSQAFAGLSLDGRLMVFDTNLVMQLADGQTGSPMFPIDPLIYAYNLAVLSALLLAGPTRKHLLRRLLFGYLLLMPAWVWGISFQFAKIAAFDLGPELSAQVGEPGWWLELVALGYQFGYLVLPVFALVLAWYLLSREDLAALAGVTAAPANAIAAPSGNAPRTKRRRQRDTERRRAAARRGRR